MIDFGEMLKAYFCNEGWHRVYKRHFHQVKHNYDVKKRIKKRFGENRAQAFRNELKRPLEDTIFGKIKGTKTCSSVVVELDNP